MASPRNRRRGIPTIACYNRAKKDLGCTMGELIDAMQIYINQHIEPVWGTPARLVPANKYRHGTWTLVFVDHFTDPDDADTIGYHHVNRDGLPKSIVFVESALDESDNVALTASHEIVEMLVDPGVNLMTLGPRENTFYAYESADPVEESSRKINGLEMSNFVYPEYFEDFHGKGSMRFDWVGEVDEPFQIMPGGYQSMFTRGGWTDKTGSEAKRKRFANEDRRGHRSEFRRSGGFSALSRAKKVTRPIPAR